MSQGSLRLDINSDRRPQWSLLMLSCRPTGNCAAWDLESPHYLVRACSRTSCLPKCSTHAVLLNTVGGTSGLGLSTALALARHSVSPHIFIVGRNEAIFPSIESQCKSINPDAKVEFLPTDVTELAAVDKVCSDFRKKVPRLNLLVMSQGNLNLRGRDGGLFLSFSFCISLLSSSLPQYHLTRHKMLISLYLLC